MKFKCICGKEREGNSIAFYSRKCPYCGLTFAKSEEIKVGRYLEVYQKFSMGDKVKLLEAAHRCRPDNHKGEVKGLVEFIENHLDEICETKIDVHYLLADFYYEGYCVRRNLHKSRAYNEQSIALHGRNICNSSIKLMLDSNDGLLKPGEFTETIEKFARGEC